MFNLSLSIPTLLIKAFSNSCAAYSSVTSSEKDPSSVASNMSVRYKKHCSCDIHCSKENLTSLLGQICPWPFYTPR